MKILEQKYPMGSFPGQQSPGRYFDATYHANLKILAEKIVDDMTFLALCSSSTLEVGTGKSVFMQQTGEAYTDLVNQIHKTKLDFTMKNIVFNSDDLITRAFELPKYSCLILDEGDDLDQNYYSTLAKNLRKFFRKCRQLNLFIIVILPNFFQIPSAYAISRSVFFIDVRFEGKFDRGYFSFYSFKRKKEIYIRGKKTQDYGIAHPDFKGRFTKGYAVDEKQYRDAKYRDMLKDLEDEKPKLTEKGIKVNLFKQIHNNLPEIPIKKLALGFGIASRTAFRWLNEPRMADNDAEPPNTYFLNQEGDN
jgi:hypothetical protein